MNNLAEYHKAYNNAYHQPNDIIYYKSYYNLKKILIAISFLSFSFLLAFFLDSFFIYEQYNNKNSVHNFASLSDEIVYNNIFGEDNTKTTIENFEKDKNINVRNQLKKEIYNLKEQFVFNKIIQKSSTGFSKISEVSSTKNIDLQKDSLTFNKFIIQNNISERKKQFINTILPIIIEQNQKILVQREALLKIKRSLNQNKTLDKEDQKFLDNLSSKYLVLNNNKHKIDIINELLVRVDIIPNSIVLAQAANESGWGTSRFAKEYNAIFGEYTYDASMGIVPYKREKGKKHLIKHFTSINQSVFSYFKNINSHYAYSEFRKLRASQKEKHVDLIVNSLLDKLNVYAEDSNYVDTIASIIKVNNLKQYDNIQLLKTIL